MELLFLRYFRCCKKHLGVKHFKLHFNVCIILVGNIYVCKKCFIYICYIFNMYVFVHVLCVCLFKINEYIGKINFNNC